MIAAAAGPDPRAAATARPRRCSTTARRPGPTSSLIDDVVVLGDGGDLAARDLEPALNRRPRCPCCAGAAAPRAPQRTAAARRRRRCSKPRNRTCRAPCTSMTSTRSCPPASTRSVSLRRRAVVVAEHLGVLEEIAVGDHPRRSRCAADEIIVHPVGLARPRRARGERPRHGEIRHVVHQALDQRRLARAGRRRDDEQPAAPGSFTRHSGPAPASSRARLSPSRPARRRRCRRPSIRSC